MQCVCWRQKNAKCFRNDTIVHPAVGVNMERIRQHKRAKIVAGVNVAPERPKLRDDSVRLKQMWEAACGITDPQETCDL